MIWVERVPWTFVRAKIRRHMMRGKRADRSSRWRHTLYESINSAWEFVFTRQHPFLDRPFT